MPVGTTPEGQKESHRRKVRHRAPCSGGVLLYVFGLAGVVTKGEGGRACSTGVPRRSPIQFPLAMVVFRLGWGQMLAEASRCPQSCGPGSRADSPGLSLPPAPSHILLRFEGSERAPPKGPGIPSGARKGRPLTTWTGQSQLPRAPSLERHRGLPLGAGGRGSGVWEFRVSS